VLHGVGWLIGWLVGWLGSYLCSDFQYAFLLLVTVFINTELIPVAVRSKVWVCSCLLAGIVGLRGCVSVVSVLYCQVVVCASRLITHPEESYRVWCV